MSGENVWIYKYISIWEFKYKKLQLNA